MDAPQWVEAVAELCIHPSFTADWSTSPCYQQQQRQVRGHHHVPPPPRHPELQPVGGQLGGGGGVLGSTRRCRMCATAFPDG